MHQIESMNSQELTLVTPTAMLRLGSAKHANLKRAQDVIEIFAWSTVVFLIATFMINGGLKQVTDLPSALNALSRLTALIGTDLLLIQMVLTARVPWIDKFYGHDKATVAHKKLGKPILYFVVAHFLASLIEFSITNAQDVFATLWWFITDVQDMLLATISLALMILVVVTSLNFARRKLSYEAWFIVHLFAYAAVLTAVPHIFTAGSDVQGKPVETIFWVSLYLFVLFNILWYRVTKPLIRAAGIGLKIDRVVRESSDTTSLYLTGKNLAKLGGQSGQFYLLRILTKERWHKAHPFSISAAPNSQHMRFTIGDRGDDTGAMQSIKAGTRVMVEGPYGVFTEERRTKERVVLIASGIGIPPIRALAESMAARPGDITVIYRVRNDQDASLLNEIREICRIRGFALHVLAGPRASSSSWMNADGSNHPDIARLAVMAPWISESDVYVCGPERWTHLVHKSLLRAGTPEEQIHSEEYAW